MIELISHPHPFETLQARTDFAEVAGVDIVENPWWFRHKGTGRLYYDIHGCIGWPEDITGRQTQQPGYIAIVGVVKPKDAEKIGFDASRARFHVIEEYQSLDVPTLLNKCVSLREKYGFGLAKRLMTFWYGDPDRFVTAVALRNENLVRQGGENAAIVIAPPNDYNLKNRFEVYLRALKGTLQGQPPRLFVGNILKTRLQEFTKDDPAVTAVGGLVHTLLGRTMWMGQREGDNAFWLKEAI